MANHKSVLTSTSSLFKFHIHFIYSWTVTHWMFVLRTAVFICFPHVTWLDMEGNKPLNLFRRTFSRNIKLTTKAISVGSEILWTVIAFTLRTTRIKLSFLLSSMKCYMRCQKNLPSVWARVWSKENVAGVWTERGGVRITGCFRIWFRKMYTEGIWKRRFYMRHLREIKLYLSDREL
jgi:hypothetical protein